MPTAAPTIPALKENLALGVCWAPRAEMKDPEEIMQDALLIRRHFRQVCTRVVCWDGGGQGMRMYTIQIHGHPD